MDRPTMSIKHNNQFLNLFDKNGPVKRYYSKWFNCRINKSYLRDIAPTNISLDGKTKQHLYFMSAAKNLSWYSSQELFSQFQWLTFLWHHYSTRNRHSKEFCKNVLLIISQNSVKSTCTGVSFLSLLKNRDRPRVFFCKHSILLRAHFYRTLLCNYFYSNRDNFTMNIWKDLENSFMSKIRKKLYQDLKELTASNGKHLLKKFPRGIV